MSTNKNGSFRIDWTIELSRNGVFIADFDCELDGEWSVTDGDFEIEVGSIIIGDLNSFTAIRRPERAELHPDCLAVVLFRALDADWQKLSERVYEQEVLS